MRRARMPACPPFTAYHLFSYMYQLSDRELYRAAQPQACVQGCALCLWAQIVLWSRLYSML